MGTEQALGLVAADQKRWSLTANNLKQSIDRWRIIVLLLSICGAILGTWASQHAAEVTAVKICAYTASAAIALIAVFRQWRLGRDRVHGWIMARAASESLKREMYLYRASAGTYSSGDRDSLLLDSRDAVVDKVRAAEGYIVEPGKVADVPASIDATTYISERVDGQITWFRKKASQAAAAQGRFEVAEFMLAAIGALLGASLTLGFKNAQLGAWVAVITTMVGALGAHVQTQRYSQLTVNYRTTASRLEGIRARWRSSNGSLPTLVQLCESVLSDENQGWIAGVDEGLKGAVLPAGEKTDTKPEASN